MSIEIMHIDGHVLTVIDHDHRGLIGLENADLRGADLRGVTLAHERVPIGCHVDIHGKHAPGMVGWRLDGADLSGANFSGSDISTATFVGANLTGAKFDGARLNWCSHDVTSAILRQAAGDDPEKLEVAGINLANRQWTYSHFAELGHPGFDWAMSVLRAFVRTGDQAPEHVTRGSG